MLLKVHPRKGVSRIGKGGKLQPRYVGPYEILERIGRVAYRLDLPPSETRIHPVFHISQLKKYHHDPSHVLPIETLPLEPDLSYVEIPMEVTGRKIKVLRNREIPLVKVLWKNHNVLESTWEREDEIRAKYPDLPGL